MTFNDYEREFYSIDGSAFNHLDTVSRERYRLYLDAILLLMRFIKSNISFSHLLPLDKMELIYKCVIDALTLDLTKRQLMFRLSRNNLVFDRFIEQVATFISNEELVKELLQERTIPTYENTTA